jgi:hypothetical protein
MRTDLQTMGCGACGCFAFRVYQTKQGWYAIECAKCLSVSVLRPVAEIRVDWGDEHGMLAEGVLAPMAAKENGK